MTLPLTSASRTEINGPPVDAAEAWHGGCPGVGAQGVRVAGAAEADDAEGRVHPRGVDGAWAKLRVAESRGIAVVSFADIALINDVEIREVDRELRRLIELGHNRIALNFGNVVRLSSQVIATVLKTHRQCTASGGTVKICQIHPDLQKIFALTGVFLTIDIYPDVRSALESEWPRPAPLRPSPATPSSPPQPDPSGPALPLDAIFASTPPAPRPAPPSMNGWNGTHLKDDGRGNARPTPPDAPSDPSASAIPLDDASPPPRHAEPSPRPTPVATPDTESSGAVAMAPLPLVGEGENSLFGTIPHERPEKNGVDNTPARRETHSTPTASHEGTVAPPSRPGATAARVRLIVLVGRARGRAVEIPAPRFLIGRDPSCHLRAVSPIVSRFHALIEHRNGQVFLRDLGSSNGTTLGDRMLQGHEEVELADGQRLQVGPMQFTVSIAPVAGAVSSSPTGPRPIPSAPPGTLSQDPSLHPLLHCPQCGTDGWIAIDQLLPQLLHAIAHALSPASAATVQAPPVSPLQAPVPHWHTVPTPGLVPVAQPSTAAPKMHVGHRNGHAVAGAHPAPPIALPGPAAPAAPAASEPRPIADHAAPSGRRPPESPDASEFPTVEVSVATPEDEVSEFLDVVDLLPMETPSAPAEARPAPSGPGPRAPRSLDIDFRCPECGTQGWIPVDRLDRQLQCQACGVKLFTDPSGGLLVGDISERPRTPNAFEDRQTDLLGRAIDRWKALPRVARVALSGVAALLLCALLGWVLSAPAVPASLKDRAVFVAEAFAREDYRRLRAVAASGSSAAVSRWMDQVRPRFWRGKMQRVSVRVNIQQQDKKAGKAVLLAHVVAVTGTPKAAAPQRPSSPTLEISSGRAASTPEPQAGPDNRRIDLKLHWVMSRNGQWLLDGSRTCAAAQPTQTTASPDQTPRRQLE
jgi:anti-anti-sigma factor